MMLARRLLPLISGAGRGDPHASSVVMLLRANGADGSTSVIDDAGNVVTAHGPVHISQLQGVSGGASLRLGNGGFLTAPKTAGFVVGTGDWTIEFWVYLLARKIAVFVNLGSGIGTGPRYPSIAMHADGRPYLYRYAPPSGAYVLTAGTPLPLNTWAHCAFSRRDGVVRYHVNGVLDGTASDTTDYSGTGGQVFVGQWGSTGTQYVPDCFMDEIRVTKGVGRYTNAPFKPYQSLPRI